MIYYRVYFYYRLYTMTTIYFGTIEALLSHEDGKGEVAPMSGKDDVPPLASVPADKDDVPPLAEARSLNTASASIRSKASGSTET